MVAIGKVAGSVDGVEIATKPVQTDEVDTVTLYLNPLHQKPYYDYILSLKPAGSSSIRYREPGAGRPG